MKRAERIAQVSQIVGVSFVARKFGKSRDWARALLEEWFEIQQLGGETRVFPRTVKNRVRLFTTLAVLHRHMPPGRDELLVRKVAELEADLDQLARRLADETAKRVALERKVDGLLTRGNNARRA